ncbi:hypothetical protein WJX81_005326 [Elliptochloris bilobata]|uniref:Uncharacterized protein n=1 Tax=Elliptochloris bilobata TaxID=381761 RepID=A0AAW1QJE6_9CHLO
MLEGGEQTVGALRSLAWDRGRVIERLTGYDVNNYTQKSRLISHRDNVNPFGASFLNYVTALKLTEVTIDSTTFVELEGSFETDPLEADAMHGSVSACYEARIRGLQAMLVSTLAEQQAVAAAVQAAAATAAAAEELAAQKAARRLSALRSWPR